MRIQHLILTISLGLNLLLGFFYFAPQHPFHSDHKNPVSPKEDSAPAPSTPARIDSPAPQNGKSSNAIPRQTLAARLKFDQLDGLADRLQAAGFPKSEQAAILKTLIFDRFTFEHNPAMITRENRPYWDTLHFGFPPNDIAQLMAGWAEEQKVMRQYVINTDLMSADEDVLEMSRLQFGPLASDKLQGLRMIESDFLEMNMKLRSEREQRPGQTRAYNEADRARDRLLEQEKLADIKRLLTPEEYAQYELRASPTADLLRNRLEIFKPTESEFLTLFPLQKGYDEKMKDDTLTETAKKAARGQLNAQVLAALGPQRGADAQVALQGENNRLARLLIRLDLPISTVNTVNAVRDDLNARATTIRADAQLTAAQRAAQLSALAQEARTKLATTLGGERGFEAYNDLKGDWIRAIQAKGP
jgi:hypothetical protein